MSGTEKQPDNRFWFNLRRAPALSSAKYTFLPSIPSIASRARTRDDRDSSSPGDMQEERVLPAKTGGRKLPTVNYGISRKKTSPRIQVSPQFAGEVARMRQTLKDLKERNTRQARCLINPDSRLMGLWDVMTTAADLPYNIVMVGGERRHVNEF